MIDIENSLGVAIKSKPDIVSEINTFDCSTLYTSLPFNLVKTHLVESVQKTFSREKSRKDISYLYCPCEYVCDILCFLLDNSSLCSGMACIHKLQ